jgi:hypothetical protein
MNANRSSVSYVKSVLPNPGWAALPLFDRTRVGWRRRVECRPMRSLSTPDHRAAVLRRFSSSGLSLAALWSIKRCGLGAGDIAPLSKPGWHHRRPPVRSDTRQRRSGQFSMLEGGSRLHAPRISAANPRSKSTPRMRTACSHLGSALSRKSLAALGT